MLQTAFKQLPDDRKFVQNNLLYASLMGSHAYNLQGPDSDIDIYGVCMPPLEMIFPSAFGEIDAFGPKSERFEQWRQDNISYEETELDITIFGLPRYFQLLMENNPNIVDSLFVPEEKLLHQNDVGKKIRDNRKLFLHQGLMTKFMGYAKSQLDKVKNRQPEGKRLALVEKWGYDIKHAYHLMRLLYECEHLLRYQDIDMLLIGFTLAPIRRGEWKLDYLLHQSESMISFLKSIEDRYISNLPEKPRYDEIRNLLIECMMQAYPGDKYFLADLLPVVRK